MKSRLLATAVALSVAAAASAQVTGRNTTLTGYPFLGATFNANITYPPAAAGNVYGFMWSAPFAGSFPLVVPGFTFPKVGELPSGVAVPPADTSIVFVSNLGSRTVQTVSSTENTVPRMPTVAVLTLSL